MKQFLALLISLLFSTLIAAQCTELFISEYAANPGYNSHSALEIYNPTQSAIDLSNYRLIKWRSGLRPFTPGPSEIFLNGIIGAKETYVIVGDMIPSDPVLLALADTIFCTATVYTCSPLRWSGVDALTLEKYIGNNWEIIDAIGTIIDAFVGSWGWNDIPPTHLAMSEESSWTSNQTLIRKNGIGIGDTDTSFFNPAIEWDSFPGGTYANLGMHSCICPTTAVKDLASDSLLEIFPNPISSLHNKLTINSTKQIDAYSIFDVTGNIILTDSFKKGSQEIQIQLVESLPPGMYLLRVDYKDQFRVSKIIIQ